MFERFSRKMLTRCTGLRVQAVAPESKDTRMVWQRSLSRWSFLKLRDDLKRACTLQLQVTARDALIAWNENIIETPTKCRLSVQ